MALGQIDKLLNVLQKTEGQGLPFSLLGAGGQGASGVAKPNAPISPEDTAGQNIAPPQKSPDVFSSVGGAAQGVSEAVSSAVKPAQDLSKNISRGIAKSIESGINAIFDVGLSKEDKQLREEAGGQTATDRFKDFASNAKVANIEKPETAAPPQLLTPSPLQGGSSRQPQAPVGAPPTGVNRLQEILAQQAELRNQIRSRRQ